MKTLGSNIVLAVLATGLVLTLGCTNRVNKSWERGVKKDANSKVAAANKGKADSEAKSNEANKKASEEIARLQAELQKMKDGEAAVQALAAQTQLDKEEVQKLRADSEVEVKQLEEVRQQKEVAEAAAKAAEAAAAVQIQANDERLKEIENEMAANVEQGKKNEELVAEKEALVKQNDEQLQQIEVQKQQLAQAQADFAKEVAEERAKLQAQVEEAKAQIEAGVKIAKDSIWYPPAQKLFELYMKDPNVAVPMLVSFESGAAGTPSGKAAIDEAKSKIKEINENTNYEKIWLPEGWNASIYGAGYTTAKDTFLIQAQPAKAIALYHQFMSIDKSVIRIGDADVDVSDFVLKFRLVNKVRISPTLVIYDGSGNPTSMPLNQYVVQSDDVLSPNVDFSNPLTYIFGEHSTACRQVGLECIQYLNDNNFLSRQSIVSYGGLPPALKASKKPVSSGALNLTTTVKASAYEVLKAFVDSTVSVLAGPATDGSAQANISVRDPSARNYAFQPSMNARSKEMINEVALTFSAEFYDEEREGLRNSETTMIPLLGKDKRALFINGVIPTGLVPRLTYFSDMQTALEQPASNQAAQ